VKPSRCPTRSIWRVGRPMSSHVPHTGLTNQNREGRTEGRKGKGSGSGPKHCAKA
jgi:hypothetical protein